MPTDPSIATATTNRAAGVSTRKEPHTPPRRPDLRPHTPSPPPPHCPVASASCLTPHPHIRERTTPRGGFPRASDAVGLVRLEVDKRLSEPAQRLATVSITPKREQVLVLGYHNLRAIDFSTPSVVAERSSFVGGRRRSAPSLGCIPTSQRRGTGADGSKEGKAGSDSRIRRNPL